MYFERERREKKETKSKTAIALSSEYLQIPDLHAQALTAH